MIPQFKVFDVDPPASLERAQLQFYARSILATNPTAAWWYLPEQQDYVPPYTLGKVIPSNGTQIATVLFQAPVGVTQPTTLPEGQATFVFSEEAHAPQMGLSAYALTPPFANLEYVAIPAAPSTVEYHLKGYAQELTILVYATDNAQVVGSINVAFLAAVGNGIAATFYAQITDFATDNGNLTKAFIRAPFPLPATTRITLSHSLAGLNTINAVVFY